MITKIGWYDDNLGEEIIKSFRETGFAVITDVPIAQFLVERVYDYWKDFFRNEREFKDSFLFDKDKQQGYYPMCSENAKDHNIPDLKEFFHLYPERSAELDGVLDLRKTRLLQREMSALGIALLSIIDTSLPKDVKDNLSMSLPQMASGSPKTLLRIIYYPTMDNLDQSLLKDGKAVRAAAHEDINLITLLPAATAEGLEVKDVHGNWHSIGVLEENSMVVNSGEMLTLCTNGFLPSTTHRVVNNDLSEPRFSMPMFIHPHPEVQLSPNKTAEEYLKERLAEIGLA